MIHNFPETKFTKNTENGQIRHVLTEAEEVKEEFYRQNRDDEALWDELADLFHSLETLSRINPKKWESAILRVFAKNIAREYYRIE